MLQDSSGFNINGGTFNAVEGNQINHTHIYPGKFLGFQKKKCSISLRKQAMVMVSSFMT